MFGLLCLDSSIKKHTPSLSRHIKKKLSSGDKKTKLLLDKPEGSSDKEQHLKSRPCNADSGHIMKKLLLDQPEGSSHEGQHLKSHPSYADSEASAVGIEQKSVTFTKLSDLQRVDQKESVEAGSIALFKTKVLHSKLEGSSDREQLLKSQLFSADSQTSSLDTEQRNVTLTKLTDLQPVDQIDSAVPSRIILRIPAHAVSDQKARHKKRVSSDSSKCRKSLDSDAVPKHGEKAEIKVKKRVKSKSAGHGNKDGTDSKTLTSNKASASLNEPLGSHSASSGKFESVAFVEKPQSRSFSDTSSRTEEYVTEANTDTVTTDAETVVGDESSVLSLNELPECDTLSDVVIAGKPQSEVNSIVAVNEDHTTNTGDSSMLTAVVDRGTGLCSSLQHIQKKSSSKDDICEPGQKPHCTVKKCTKSYTELQFTPSDKSITETKLKDADSGLNSQKCKSQVSGTGLSGQKVRAIVKNVDSDRKVQVHESSMTVEVSNVARLSSGHQTRKASGVAGRSELLQSLWKELDSGLRGVQPSTSSLSEGQSKDLRRSTVSENAAKSLAPKPHKTPGGTHLTKEATSVSRSGEHSHTKHRVDRTSVVEPPHHQHSHSYMSAGRHYKIPHKQRHTSSHSEHHSESAAARTSAVQAKKQDAKEPSFVGHDSANFHRPHPETHRPQKHAGGSHQVDSAPVHSVDAVPQAEKPKNKVVSLADYRKRKRDVVTSATAATSSVPTRVTQSASPLCIKSSLAEQLIVSYSKRSGITEGVDEPMPATVQSVDDQAGDKNVLNQTLQNAATSLVPKPHKTPGATQATTSPHIDEHLCSKPPVPVIPLEPLDSAYDPVVTAKHFEVHTDCRGSVDDTYSFNFSGWCAAAQPKTGTALFDAKTPHAVCSSVDIQDLSSSSSSLANEMLSESFSGTSTGVTEPMPIPLIGVTCEPDDDKNVAEVSKMEVLCSSDSSLATGPPEKADVLHESPTALGGGDTGFVPSLCPLLSQKVDTDENANYKLQFVSVRNQDAAEMMTGNSSAKTLSHDVLEVQRQSVEQTDEQHYFSLDNLKKDEVDATNQNHMEDDESDVLTSLFHALPGSKVQNTSAGLSLHNTTDRDVENTELGIYI